MGMSEPETDDREVRAREAIRRLRSTKTWGGRPILSRDALLQSREECLPLRPLLDRGGKPLTRDAAIESARRNPGKAAIHLEWLVTEGREAWPGIWALIRDCWLLSGDLDTAIHSRPPIDLSKVWKLDVNARLTLKWLAGGRIDAVDLLNLGPQKFTKQISEHLQELSRLMQLRLDLEEEAGRNLLDELVANPDLAWAPWPLFNATTQSRPVEEFPCAQVSELREAIYLAETVQRAGENALREDLGLPHVGEGWVSETRLFVELDKTLDTKVIQHGSPEGLGRQHLDVWLPEWRVGVEFQGLQHYQPVNFFGGEEGFRQTLERDRRKKEKARRMGITIVYVREGYSLANVLHEVRAARSEGISGNDSPFRNHESKTAADEREMQSIRRLNVVSPGEWRPDEVPPISLSEALTWRSLAEEFEVPELANLQGPTVKQRNEDAGVSFNQSAMAYQKAGEQILELKTLLEGVAARVDTPFTYERTALLLEKQGRLMAALKVCHAWFELSGPSGARNTERKIIRRSQRLADRLIGEMGP